METDTLHQKANYGLDAPQAIRNFFLISVSLISAGIICHFTIPTKSSQILNIINQILTYTFIISGIFIFYPVISLPLGSLIFKFHARDWLLDSIQWNNMNKILDVGCGSGLLLIGAAKRVPSLGKVYGIDIWDVNDQSGNKIQRTLKNIEIENVQTRVEIKTADMRQIPYSDNCFDLILSSWAIHNLKRKQDRLDALKEIVRVCKPNGQIALMDIKKYKEYKQFFIENGLIDIQMVGPKFTFGNPTYIVKATKV